MNDLLQSAGVFSWRAIRACPVEDAWVERYMRWIGRGGNAEMGYLDRWHEVRNDPRLLIREDEGGPAQSMIVCLLPYPRNVEYEEGRKVAAFAQAPSNYHKSIKRALFPVATALTERYGGVSRVCVDSAPVRERYWAARCGLGEIGRNNHLRVPGHGAAFHIAEIVLSALLPGAEVPPELGTACPCPPECSLCARACPAGALAPDGTLDAARCIAYRTIERKEPGPIHGWIRGCDECRLACPLC